MLRPSLKFFKNSHQLSSKACFFGLTLLVLSSFTRSSLTSTRSKIGSFSNPTPNPRVKLSQVSHKTKENGSQRGFAHHWRKKTRKVLLHTRSTHFCTWLGKLCPTSPCKTCATHLLCSFWVNLIFSQLCRSKRPLMRYTFDYLFSYIAKSSSSGQRFLFEYADHFLFPKFVSFFEKQPWNWKHETKAKQGTSTSPHT